LGLDRSIEHGTGAMERSNGHSECPDRLKERAAGNVKHHDARSAYIGGNLQQVGLRLRQDKRSNSVRTFVADFRTIFSEKSANSQPNVFNSKQLTDGAWCARQQEG